MTLKVQKIGNSYMVTIPKILKEMAGLERGDEVEMELEDNSIQIKWPSKERKPVTAMASDLEIEGFNFEKSMKDVKKASYAR